MLSIIIIGMHACTHSNCLYACMHGCLYQLDLIYDTACRDPKILTLNMSQDFSISTESHPQFFKYCTHAEKYYLARFIRCIYIYSSWFILYDI